MKLVVGLGNPGRNFEGTRHNLGFVVVEELARRHRAAAEKDNFFGKLTEIQLPTDRVLLLRPQTFMNLSGKSVLAARDFFKLPDAELLVVCDDLNLPLGKVRVRSSGSDGGHNGLEDVIRVLGQAAVPRLRIGIDRPPGDRDPKQWVLARFGRHEQAEIELAIARAADAVEVWVRAGVETCMNQFN